jgi:hypothetical protein
VGIGLAFPAALRGQALEDFCPDGDASSEAAVIGIVTDTENGMILPGAEVTATWTVEGTRRRATVQTGIDGVYTICGLPRGLDMQVRALLGDRGGQPAQFNTTTVLQQRDLDVSLTGDAEEQALADLDESVSMSRVFNATVIREEDLVGFPEMTVYQLLRQHQKLRFERVSGGEYIVFVGRGVTGQPSLSGMGRFRGVEVLINERREADPISAIRDMYIDEIKQLDILSPGEASGRYGGDGWLGAIAIRTRDR